ncbi:MAG TPA: hypothetical protein DD400_05295 [Rhodospirillaceae bacterium]|nr:hypothetical protein [Rhodospirillaceae bacterium]
MRRKWELFLASSRMGFKNVLADKILIAGSFLIYAMIVILYGGLIKLIPDADLAVYGFSHAQMIWYIGTTEFILFTSSSWSFKEVQGDFTSGEAHLRILRPASYAFVRFSFWSGESLARVVILFPLYFILIGWFSGEFVLSWIGFLGLLLSMPLAALMMNCGAYIIGASCLWFVQSEPAAWIWQKSIFLLGAMLWPLVFYPVWAQNIVWMLPFHGILAHGGNWALDLPMQTYVFGFINQIIWAVLSLWGLRRFDRLVLRRVQSGET